jgi:eukaryotic-like serine/threonine-protein kinase
MATLASNSIRSGDLLDHYRLEDLVATGGMALVFRATDTKTGRPVAIKVPHPEKAGDRFTLGRFLREAQIGRKLDHPGLVKILPNSGASDRYVIMEWVEGQTLRQIIDAQGKLSPEHAVRIALAICDALVYLHRLGIMHRDLKPENVMVDTAGNIKLIDFGTAGKSNGNLGKQGRTGEAMGTPDYASPEQINGRPGDVRSDVYSLGIMLFEMLAGEVPFSGLDPVTAMNLRSRIDPPSLGELNPDIPRRLQVVVDQAIARHRAMRYASAREFSSELSDLIANESVALPLNSLARS